MRFFHIIKLLYLYIIHEFWMYTLPIYPANIQRIQIISRHIEKQLELIER